MQFWILSIILLACGTIGVHSLQCYECSGDECNNINDSMSHYCGPQTTTTTQETPTATTADNTGSSASAQSSTTSTTSEATSESTENTRSSPSSTNEATTTTNLPTETTIPFEETLPPTSELAQSVRQRRSLIANPKASPADVLLTNYWLGSNKTRADSSYFCYSASIPDGDSSKRKHGCVEVAAGKESCDAVRELNSIPSNTDTKYACCTCQTDNCNNGAGHLKDISVLMLLVALIVQKFCK